MVSPNILLLFLTVSLTQVFGSKSDQYQLKQVIILSRSNVRSSATGNLHKYTTKTWPQQSTDPRNLTRKGSVLEANMGAYFTELFFKQLFNKTSEDWCPEEKKVYVYADTLNSTLESAKSFIEGAFNNCTIMVDNKGTTDVDPIFDAVVHNDSESHTAEVRNEMEQKFKAYGRRLRKAFDKLNDILDIKSSEICKEESICDLNEAKNEYIVNVGEEPTVRGPLFIGSNVIDFFLMNYYDGMPTNKLGWGLLKSSRTWRTLTEISRADLNVRYNTTEGAKDIAGPLLKYMADIFRNDTRKLILVVGHDYNLSPVMNGMGFKPYNLPLPGQLESIPVGSKIVFQKWTDGVKDYLKVNFIYASGVQIRSGMKLSLKSGVKPQSVQMDLEHCKTDRDGFCLWSDFVKNLPF